MAQTISKFQAYTPADSGDWITPPVNVGEGLDELALRTNSLEWVYEAKNANFTAAYRVIYGITGAVDVQLPSPVAAGELKLFLKGTANVNLLRAGSENIQGVAATYAVTSDRSAIHLFTDGTDWFLI